MAAIERALGLGLCSLAALGCELGGALAIDGSPPPVSTGSTGGQGSDEPWSGGVDSLPGPPTGDPSAGDPSAGEDSEGGDGGGAPVIVAGARWRYRVGDAPADWSALELDDGAWEEGPAPLGFGLEVATELPAGAVAYYFRHRFAAAEVDAIAQLLVHLRRDDGALVMLNGVELSRSNMPEGPTTSATLSDSAAGGLDPLRFYKHPVPADALREGENVLAVAVHQRAADSGDLVFDLDLRPLDPAAPLERVYVRARTRTWGGKYGPRNVGAIWIEREDGGFVRTLERWAAVRAQHLVQWNAASGGNLVDAITSATSDDHRARALEWDLRDADGQPAPAGVYRLRVEVTEDNSNGGGADSRHVAIPFTLGQGPTVVAPADESSFRDMLLMVP